MELFPIVYQDFRGFLLVLIRVTVILFMFPLFNARVIPILAKVGLALMITLIFHGLVHVDPQIFPESPAGLVRVVTAELATGMLLGLLVQIFFEGVRIMGQMVGFQTGFAITNVIDPQSSVQVSILANLSYMTAFTAFLAINGHHVLLNALKESFELVPVGSFHLNEGLLDRLIPLTGEMFLIAVKIGSPLIAAIIITQMIFGLLNKLMPQMSIMIVAFPVQIVVGLFFLGICMDVLLGFTENYVSGLGPALTEMMELVKG